MTRCPRSISEHGSPFRVETTSSGAFLADVVLVTIGANPRKLGIPGEDEYVGHGVSYCATCDGFFFRGKDIVVVGGGNSALQEALFLTKFGRTVNVIHRRDETARQRRPANAAPSPMRRSASPGTPSSRKSKPTTHGSVEKIVTAQCQDRRLSTSSLPKACSSSSATIPTATSSRASSPADAAGYVIVDQRYRTNVEGVFAAGEIHDQIFRQAMTAAGDGCAAALMAIAWLEEREGQLQNLDQDAQALAEV